MSLVQFIRPFCGSVLLWIGAVASAQTNPPPHNPPYPVHWWAEVSKEGAPSWEIFPQDARYGEVILSKRHELGLLSNFAATPFVFRSKKYASVEGFWQATKFPENAEDPRANFPEVHWPYSRAEVEQMTAFDAKHAGDVASENMKKMGVSYVTFEGEKLIYKQPGESPFYKLIVQVMRAKLEQNEEVKSVLLRTGDLKLKPDHSPGPAELRAWQFHEIWMMFRAELQHSAAETTAKGSWSCD
jgi:predicted NAD-dependent protein-ADP-ribosyltransferase YbiA (DUF1768 family)